MYTEWRSHLRLHGLVSTLCVMFAHRLAWHGQVFLGSTKSEGRHLQCQSGCFSGSARPAGPHSDHSAGIMVGSPLAGLHHHDGLGILIHRLHIVCAATPEGTLSLIACASPGNPQLDGHVGPYIRFQPLHASCG